MSLLRPQGDVLIVTAGCWDSPLKAVLEEPKLWDTNRGSGDCVLVHQIYEVHPSSPDHPVQFWN